MAERLGDFKYALFAYESGELPEPQRVVEGILDVFRAGPFKAETWITRAASLEEAAAEADRFKSRTCGSAFNLALINLNGLPGAEELRFLLRPNVLGDPISLFMVSLKMMQGDLYTTAKEKVEREAQKGNAPGTYRSPSCLDGYSPVTREEAAARCGELLTAYLREAEERAAARQEGRDRFLSLRNSPVTQVLRKSQTTYYGRRSGVSSDRFRALPRDTARPYNTPTLGPRPQGHTDYPPLKK